MSNKYATFYSGAFAWTASNEIFLKDVSWLSRLKFRLSYGQNGNEAIPVYQSLAKISAGSAYAFGDAGTSENGAAVTRLANDNLLWETSESGNIAVDFGFFNNRLSGTIEYYSQESVNLLLNRNNPRIIGIASSLVNIGKLGNKGLEITLNGSPVRSENFIWDIGFVFAKNENKLISLYGFDNDGDGQEDDLVSNSWFIGKPLGTIFGYGVDGVYQLDDTNIPSGFRPGDFRIIDYDGDGDITVNDRHILGNSTPNFQFSISNTFRYKNFSLYAMINSVQGGGSNNYYIKNNIRMHNPNAVFSTWSERFNFPVMDYWTPTNPSNTASRIDYLASRPHGVFEDRSFVRLQDVILSYNLDQSMLDKIKIEGIRIYVSGKNLVTWTDWTGYDPETGTTIGGSPMLRTVNLGVDFNF